MQRRAPLDLNAGDDRRFRVYVLRLKNGDLYVGSTAKSINQRFEDHLDTSREQRAKAVKRHGLKSLEVRYCIRKAYASRNAAVKAERRLAERLRASFVRRGKSNVVHQR